MRSRTLLVPVLLGVISLSASPGDIQDLPHLKDGKARAAIHRNWSGEHVKPGGTYEVNLKGPAIITHIQVTVAPRGAKTLRQTILEMYWDGEKNASVRSPIADFFCDAFAGQSLPFANLLTGNRSGAWHSYFQMPFRKSARIVFRNLGSETLTTIAHEIDYRQVPALEPEIAYFHACFRRENPTREDIPYTILEAKGCGLYIGLNLSMQSLAGTFWFMEGNTEIYADGEEKPSVENVGTEDYFNGGWYFDQGPYSGPYSGLTVKDEVLHRIAAYRFLVHDAIPFRQSLRVLIHHGEGSRGRKGKADYSSVAYWYQREPHEPLPELPGPDGLLLTCPVREPPAGYLLDPRKARASDARETEFTWRKDCQDDIPGDHEVYGGWQDPKDYHNYLAYGRALIRGAWRTGVLVLAFPDKNCIRACWPIEAKAGQRLQLILGLTDRAIRDTRTGAAARVTLEAGGAETEILMEKLHPGDGRLIRVSRRLTGEEKKFTVEIDNRESEYWSVVYLEASLRGS